MANGYSGLPDGALASDFTTGYNNPFQSFMQGLQSYGLGDVMDTAISPNDVSAFRSGGTVPTLGGGSTGNLGGSAVGNNSIMKTLFGGDGQLGQFGAIAGGIGDLMSGYAGLQAYKTAQDNLKFQKEAFNKNFQAQGRTTNAALNNRYISANSARGKDAVGPNPFGTLEEYKQRTNIRGIAA